MNVKTMNLTGHVCANCQKKPEHKVCVDCVIRLFKDSYRVHNIGIDGNDEAGTCIFHYVSGNSHGLCKKCDTRGICLYCPAIFVEREFRNESGRAVAYEKCNCKVILDIGWVDRNNDVHGAINRVYRKDEDERDRLNDLWTRLCNDYPRMMRELRSIPSRDMGARNTIANRYNAEWNKI